MMEVARVAGVTQATVSLALRGSPKISRETRDKVAAAAKRLGYRPDPLVSALMAQRRRGRAAKPGLTTLAVVSLWPDRNESWLTQPFYIAYREGVAGRAERLGYRLSYFECDGSAKQARVVQRAIRARGIEGVLIPQAHESVTELPFDVSGWAAAYIGNGIRMPHLSRADAALDFDLRLAWRRVRAEGFRRIGFLTTKAATAKNDGAWMGAFLNAQRELAEADRLPPLELAAVSARDIGEWATRWRPAAVLSDNTRVLELVGKNHPELPAYSVALPENSDWPGVQVGREQIAAAAVDLVVAQLTRGERGVPAIAKRVVIEGWWFAGNSPRRGVAQNVL